jgi:glycerate-2-kinase
VDCLNSRGVNTVLLSDALTGEAREQASALTDLAHKALGCSVFGSKPFAIIAGGETTVTVRGKGLGGRNQELALSAALNLKENRDWVFASLSTDGIDGPTNAAGAIADAYTLTKAEISGLDPKGYLAENDSYHIFEKIGDLILTGATETNVNDILMIII